MSWLRSAEHGVDDLLPDVRGQRGVEVDARGVLRREHDGVQPHRRGAVVLDGDLGLAVGPQVVQHAVLAHLGQPARQAVGQRDRQRHQLRGVLDRVAEHQALVAGALGVQRVARRPRRGPRGRCRRPARCRATARRCRCSRRRTRRRSPCPTSRNRSRGCAARTVLVMSANASLAVVVTSPTTCTWPVVTSVSTATRDLGSCASNASSTESLMASQILSGWPSVTDSLVNSRASLTVRSLSET